MHINTRSVHKFGFPSKMQVPFRWVGGVLRRSKSASHRHNQLGLSKQKQKGRQAIASSPPSGDTPAKPAEPTSRTLVVPYTTIL